MSRIGPTSGQLLGDVRLRGTFPQVDGWGGQDLNLRPEDYESPALTD